MNSNRQSFFLLIGSVVLYATLLGPFQQYLQARQFAERLGYVPDVRLLKMVSADQKELVGAALVMQALMYFGGVVNQQAEGRLSGPGLDLAGMSRLLHSAVQLDPYNADAYYFAQGFLTWDARQYTVANDLLDYGMRFRTWDWQLPFFAGFNSAFFLKDYKKAATYYEKAADLSGQELFKRLAAKYMQESGQTELAIAYLKAVEASETNQAVKKMYQMRLKAYLEVRNIETARDRYTEKYGKTPATVEQLVHSGLLHTVPPDPYGGRFYLGEHGEVGTTSKFSFSPQKKQGNGK